MNEEEKNKKKAEEKKKRTLLQKIVNVFLYAGLGILLLLLILFGITQTSTFREYLRETVLKEANSTLNGKLYIEKIDGTIFTSLLLRNTVVTMEDDTLLKAEKIGVLTSPLQLLLKKIFVRSVEIHNADINLAADESGELNFTRLFPPSEEEIDTTASEFPFVIHIANLELKNINISLKDYSIKESADYEQLNLNDLNIRNLNLNLGAEIDLNENEYSLALNHLSFSTNVKNFSVKNIEGSFFINENNVIAKDFSLETENSDLLLNASAKNLNIFDTTGLKLDNAELSFEAGTKSFSFSDIKPFAPSLMLNGEIEFLINASGTVDELNLSEILIALDNSQIEGHGRLRNILDEELLIDLNLNGSYVNQQDIKNLTAGMDIPTYPEYGVIRFETLTFNGSPSEFNSDLSIVTDRGKIGGDFYLNLKNELMKYDINLVTNNVDIGPVAGTTSSVSLTAAVKGEGITPETFDGTVRVFANGSTINGNRIDTLRLTADADNKFINYEFKLVSNELNASLKGNFDFIPEEPEYIIKGEVNNLNLAEFVGDTTLQSNLNLTLDAEGNGFDQDNLDLFLVAALYNISFGNVKIDSTRLIVDVRSDPGDRVLNIISDLADITVMGNYRVAQAVDLITSELEVVSTAFQDKMNSIFPVVAGEGPETKAGIKSREPLFTQVDDTVSINYLIDLKDFGLVSAFIGDHNLDVDAEISGVLENTTGDSVNFTFNTDLRYIKYYNDKEAYFISNLLLGLGVNNSFDAVSTADIKLNLDVNAERILAGSEIKNFEFSVNMVNDTAQIFLSAEPKPYSAKLITDLDLSRNRIDVSIDSLVFLYNDLLIQNRNDIILSYNGDRLDVNNFELFYNNSEINIKGYVSETAGQDLDINLFNWRGRDISINLMNAKPQNTVDASINLDVNVNGNFKAPVINAKLLVDSISYGNKKFGKLLSFIKYDNKNVELNLAFLDSTLNKNDTALTISGNIPIDLAFVDADTNYMENNPMQISLKSNGFNLGAFGDILPAVDKLRGEFTSELQLSGTPSSLVANGFLKIDDAAFLLEANNLEYNASLTVNINNDELVVDNLTIANIPGTENGGKMSGKGRATLNNYQITSSEFYISGDLKVLSEDSKGASASVYGELVVGTKGNIELQISEEKTFLRAPVIIKVADLTFPQTQSAYQSGSSNYIYKFAEYKSEGDTIAEKTLDELVEIAENNSEENQQTKKETAFSYNIDVTIEDEARITYVLSREFDQNLEAFLEGNITLVKNGTTPEVGGKFKLLEGSTIQFLKTLEAEGSIDFQSGELDNPNLDLVAIYSDYYYPVDGPDANEEVPVEVRIKIQGPLKDLSKKLVTNEDNIRVYYGAKNIAENTPSPEYDASDAAMFLLLGKFNDDASQQDRDEVASTAAALTGSLVGGFLNQQFGDAVRSIQLRQGSTGQTVISVVGRAGDFRYEIGTSTDVYQDLSKANVKIQYPVTKRFLVRVERKESLNRESTYTNEMITEIGLKYLFEF